MDRGLSACVFIGSSYARSNVPVYIYSTVMIIRIVYLSNN